MKKEDDCEVSIEFNGQKVSIPSKDFRELPRKVGKRNAKPMTAAQKETLDLFCKFVRGGMRSKG